MFKNQKKALILSGILLVSSSIFAQTIQDGLKMLDSEQYGNAKKVFSTLATSNPTNAEYQYYLGDYYVKVSQLDTTETAVSLDSAKIAFTKGLQLDPKLGLNYVGLGAVKYLRNDWDSSAVYFTNAIKANKKKNALVLFKIGETYLYKGKKDVKVAIPQLEEANKLDPKNTDIILALGDAYLIDDEGNGSRAVKQYNSALSINPSLAKAHIKGGKIYLLAKGYATALEYYNKGIEVDPNYAPAYRERAELYFKYAAFRVKATAEYKKYLSLSDGNYKTKFRYAYFCYEVKDYKSAIEQLVELEKINKSDKYLYRVAAYCNYEIAVSTTDSVEAKKNLSEGLSNLNNFFKLNTDTNKISLLDKEYYGKLLFKTGNDSLGIQYLKKVFAKDSTKFEFFGEVAKKYNAQKSYKKAASYFDIYYKYKKPSLNDLLTWGKTYFILEDYVKADTIFNKIVLAKPDEILGHRYRALCNAYQDKDFNKGTGVPFYEKFIEMAIAKDAVKYKNDIISGYIYIGKYYATVKNNAKSKEYWKKIVEIEPTNPIANNMLKALK